MNGKWEIVERVGAQPARITLVHSTGWTVTVYLWFNIEGKSIKREFCRARVERAGEIPIVFSRVEDLKEFLFKRGLPELPIYL